MNHAYRTQAVVDRRAEELREETGTFRCSHCGWVLEGVSMADGIVAARAHRRQSHRDLPVKSPNPDRRKSKVSRAAYAPDNESVKNEMRERLLALLKDAGQPLTAAEIASQVPGTTKAGVGLTLGWARRQGAPLHRVGSAWAYGDGPDVPRQPARKKPPPPAAAKTKTEVGGPPICSTCGEVHKLGRGYARSHEGWENWCVRNAAARRGKKLPPATRAKMSAAGKARVTRREVDPPPPPPPCDVCGQVHRRGKMGYFKSHEAWVAYREKMSASMRRRYEDPEARRRASVTALAYYRDNPRVVSDETRAKMSAAAKAQHAHRRAARETV